MVNNQFKQQFQEEILLVKNYIEFISDSDKLMYDALVYNAFIDSLCSDCETSGEAIAKLELFVEDIRLDFEVENEEMPF
jgi:hypothetical protein